MLQRQDTLNDARHAGSTFGVSYIWFDPGYDDALVAKAACHGLHFNGITDRRAGAMALKDGGLGQFLDTRNLVSPADQSRLRSRRKALSCPAYGRRY